MPRYEIAFFSPHISQWKRFAALEAEGPKEAIEAAAHLAVGRYRVTRVEGDGATWLFKVLGAEEGFALLALGPDGSSERPALAPPRQPGSKAVGRPLATGSAGGDLGSAR